ncbi:disintegrin and metalloproteinase domain-containing protein 8 isoform X8 [Papio anubis]|uniref:disintegrin and metalloproteinase domain-containing protein 8 isoform X8 n=1 Tax=Papio anubis TaxID=9555 RepID=UPI0012AD2BEC|nr:disintegrin and metalloproteinase domain-containing protein 8 isoform X8 [Papio anubis]
MLFRQFPGQMGPAAPSPAASAAIVPSRPWARVERYEVVLPRRLPGPRVRRALPSHVGLYPERVSYVLGATGHNFTLHLRKNRDLLGSGYTETYTAANGSEVTEQPRGQDHCFYQGHVEGHPDSAASLSTCAGLRGFFQVGSDLHLIEPLDEGGEGGRHAVYQAEHLLQTAGTCGVSDDSLGSLLGPRTAAVFRPQPGGSLPSRETRYVELYVVADNAEFQMLGSEAAVRHRVLEVVNHVDKLYQKLNFRVVLVGLEIWNRQDRFYVSPDPNVTLENLLAWQARRLTQRHLQDNVQLITGVDFTGTTVGLARVSAMCSHSSGAVNQDHSKNPVGVACTMAHEMGHNLGMDHDENVQGCRCREPSEAGRCIMAGSIGSAFPRMFSDCSQAYLEGFLERPQSACLANAPDLSHLVGGPVCGNLFVERGEQCDCGPPEDCRNRCCNSTTCQLAEGAQCAHGTCCQECRVKPAGEPCRPKKDTCDLEEFCDGRHPECPEDAFQENGTPCFGGYCYNGTCPTLTQQCQAFWGPGGRAAEESCFSYDILPGCKTSWYRADMCGVLQCKGGQHPPGRTSCILNHVCHALTTEDGTAYELVPEGTRCGPEKVCWKQRCQDLHVYRSRNCSAQCHSHGVCVAPRDSATATGCVWPLGTVPQPRGVQPQAGVPLPRGLGPALLREAADRGACSIREPPCHRGGGSGAPGSCGHPGRHHRLPQSPEPHPEQECDSQDHHGALQPPVSPGCQPHAGQAGGSGPNQGPPRAGPHHPRRPARQTPGLLGGSEEATPCSSGHCVQATLPSSCLCPAGTKAGHQADIRAPSTPSQTRGWCNQAWSS